MDFSRWPTSFKRLWPAAISPNRPSPWPMSFSPARCGAAKPCSAPARGPATCSTSPAHWAALPRRSPGLRNGPKPNRERARRTPARCSPPRRAFPPNSSRSLAPHLFPQPRVAQGLWLARRGLASAAIDLSDGLSTDLAHLCEESHVAAEVDAAALPIHPDATLKQALHGGEDYELLFAAPPGARVPRRIAGIPVTRIGRVLRRRKGGPTVALVHMRDGVRDRAQGAQPLRPRGWEHFC